MPIQEFKLDITHGDIRFIKSQGCEIWPCEILDGK